MAKLRVLSLFAGVGGFDLGLERTGGFETVAFCEIEPFARAILAKNWPGVPCYDDVRELTAERLAADGIAVDVICGGFPCQDLSSAGLRTGIDGERSGLWSEYARLIGELQPQYAVMENVSGLLSGGDGQWFARFLGDLASLRYDAEWHCIPAAAVGAEHHRERVWIVAYSDQDGRVHDQPIFSSLPSHVRMERLPAKVLGTPGSAWFHARGNIRDIRGDDGLSVAAHRIAALGNAVVPQIPELIGRAILGSRPVAWTRPVKSERVAKGNRQRRLNQMRAARLAMAAAADFPASQMVPF